MRLENIYIMLIHQKKKLYYKWTLKKGILLYHLEKNKDHEVRSKPISALNPMVKKKWISCSLAREHFFLVIKTKVESVVTSPNKISMIWASPSNILFPKVLKSMIWAVTAQLNNILFSKVLMSMILAVRPQVLSSSSKIELNWSGGRLGLNPGPHAQEDIGIVAPS